MEENTATNIVEIKYRKPANWRKFMARVIDVIVFGLLFGALFIPMRTIVSSFPSYKEANTLIESEQISSGLYIKNSDDTIIDIITFYNEDTYMSYGNKIKDLEEKYAYFTDEYCAEKVSNFKVENLKSNRKVFFLDEKFSFEGEKYFIEADGNIVRNPDCKAELKKYYEDVYTGFFDLYLLSFFAKEIPDVYESYKLINNFVIFLEIPVPIVIASFLTYIVPTFIFKRNRYTLGRLAYKIGLIDDKCLAVKTKKILVKNAILYFGEIIVSIFTFGIPIIISFTMSIVTKKQQTFSEYMTGIVEIDSGHTKVFFSKEEAKVEFIDTHNKAVDFKS